jgi:DNA ligase-1
MRGVAPTKPLKDQNWYASPKIDGMRAFVKDGKVLTKTGKLVPNPYVQELYSMLEGSDGELVIGKPHQDGPDDDVFARSRGLLMRKARTECNVMFCVFDRWDRPDEPFSARLGMVNDLYVRNPAKGQVWVVPHQKIQAEQASEYEARAVELGFEGAIIRAEHGLYKHGKSTEKEGYLLKLKPFDHTEAVILDVVERMTNTNEAYLDEQGYTKRSSSQAGKVPSGTLGAFVAQELAPDGSFSGPVFNVGTGKGLNDRLRAMLWAVRLTLPGRILRIKFQAVGTKDAPRIPLYDGFRDPIDISELEGL